MAILKQRDDGDSTIFLTITSTSTMSNNIPQPTDNNDGAVQIVSWVQQTSLRTINHILPVTRVSTISPSTQPKATTVYVSHNNSNEPTDSSLPPSVVESSSDEPSSTTTRRIGSMSDIPSHSTFGDITSASSSNRSTQIGLAIGIPIAIFAIFSLLWEFGIIFVHVRIKIRTNNLISTILIINQEQAMKQLLPINLILLYFHLVFI